MSLFSRYTCLVSIRRLFLRTSIPAHSHSVLNRYIRLLDEKFYASIAESARYVGIYFVYLQRFLLVTTALPVR